MGYLCGRVQQVTKAVGVVLLRLDESSAAGSCGVSNEWCGGSAKERRKNRRKRAKKQYTTQRESLDSRKETGKRTTVHIRRRG